MADTYSAEKKISIIIPALDEQKLIERLLKQFTDRVRVENNLEIIVSDGGSKDTTVKTAGKYTEKVIIKKEDSLQNISQGRNEGAKYSQGDVLIFINADTYIKDVDYFFATIRKKFSDNDLAAIACRIEVFPEEKTFIDKIFHGFYNQYVGFLNRFVMGMGRGECHIIRREKFFEAGGYDEKLVAGEDFDLYKRLRKSGNVVFLNDLIVYESPRRYRKYGYMKVFLNWTRNSISVLLFKKSISKKWEAVR